MPGPPPSPERSRSPLRGVARWLVAGAVGAAITLGVFVAMAALTEGRSLLDRMFRIFPLTSAGLSTTDECARADTIAGSAVIIEGTVGTNRGGRFQPLPDAEAIGSNAISDAIAVELAGDGRFRFVTSFPGEAPAPCVDETAPTGGERQQLVFRAPGCRERRVPVTRAWVAHPVVLDCDENPVAP